MTLGGIVAAMRVVDLGPDQGRVEDADRVQIALQRPQDVLVMLVERIDGYDLERMRLARTPVAVGPIALPEPRGSASVSMDASPTVSS